MLIQVIDDKGKAYAADKTLANMIFGIPEGTRITQFQVGANIEPMQLVADGSTMRVNLSAVRRVRDSARAAA